MQNKSKTTSEIEMVHDLLESVLRHPNLEVERHREELGRIKQVLCWVLGHSDPLKIDGMIGALAPLLDSANRLRERMNEFTSESRMGIQ